MILTKQWSLHIISSAVIFCSLRGKSFFDYLKKKRLKVPSLSSKSKVVILNRGSFWLSAWKWMFWINSNRFAVLVWLLMIFIISLGFDFISFLILIFFLNWRTNRKREIFEQFVKNHPLSINNFKTSKIA